MLSDPCLGPGARAFNLFLVVGNIWRKKRGVENININNNTMYKLHFTHPLSVFHISEILAFLSQFSRQL